jgi:hypothetical protein
VEEINYYRKLRFFQGLMFSIIFSALSVLITAIIWLIIFKTLIFYPLSLVIIGISGILLVIAGCIGPGVFKREFKLVIYHPRDGGAFHTYIKVSGFSVDPKITSADIIVNNEKLETIHFKNNIFEKVYKEDMFVPNSVNYIWLEKNGEISNKSLFTLYDPSEFTDDEIAEFEEIEEKYDKIKIQSAREDYLKDRYANLGYITLGILTTAAIVFLVGYSLEAMLSVWLNK